MPLHERQALREAIVAQLKGPDNDRTAAGARVRKSRQAPNQTDALPAISVFSSDEPIHESSAGTSPRELKRIVRVEIIGWVIGSADVDDALDALALEIETAMDIDLGFRTTEEIENGDPSYAYDSILESTVLGEKLDGERPLGAVSMTYACEYRTGRRVELPTDDFETAATQISLGDEQDDEDDRAQDEIEIPTE